MKTRGHLNQRQSAGAFTLIELIVVISIIAVLAALIFPIVRGVTRAKRFALAKSELKEMESAIDEYKTRLGYYPPDNPTNQAVNPLYFELMGTTNNGPAPTSWGTADGSAFVDNVNIVSYFGVTGLANTSTHKHSDDTATAAQSFLGELRPSQVGVIDPSGKPLVKILVCSIPWASDRQPYPVTTNPTLNPWRYNSSHPTNNVGSYDLWVDITFGNETDRICNWSADPIKL